MRNKIENFYAGIDENNARSLIETFSGSLSEVNYENADGLPLETNAKYDGTFNNGINNLKNQDIKNMITLCNECLSNVVNKIVEYKEYYESTYTNAYDAYSDKYNTFIKTPKTITQTYTYEDYDEAEKKYVQKTGTNEVSNPAYSDAKIALGSATNTLNTAEKHLNDLKVSIEQVSFSGGGSL